MQYNIITFSMNSIVLSIAHSTCRDISDRPFVWYLPLGNMCVTKQTSTVNRWIL